MELDLFLDCLLTANVPMSFGGLQTPGSRLVHIPNLTDEIELEAREQLLLSRMKIAAKLHPVHRVRANDQPSSAG